MTENELKSKLMEMMKDSGFVEELSKKVSAEEVQTFLASKGIPCTLEQVKQFGQFLKEQASTKELSADELDGVSGGSFFSLLREAASEFWNWITE